MTKPAIDEKELLAGHLTPLITAVAFGSRVLARSIERQPVVFGVGEPGQEQAHEPDGPPVDQRGVADHLEGLRPGFGADGV